MLVSCRQKTPGGTELTGAWKAEESQLHIGSFVELDFMPNNHVRYVFLVPGNQTGHADIAEATDTYGIISLGEVRVGADRGGNNLYRYRFANGNLQISRLIEDKIPEWQTFKKE